MLGSALEPWSMELKEGVKTVNGGRRGATRPGLGLEGTRERVMQRTYKVKRREAGKALFRCGAPATQDGALGAAHLRLKALAALHLPAVRPPPVVHDAAR